MQLTVRETSPVDEDWRLVVTGVAAHSEVTITVTSRDGTSTHPFEADESGTVDTAHVAPSDQAWLEPDPFGLLWSMDGPLRPGYLGRSTTPLVYSLVATGTDPHGQLVTATAEAQRVFVTDAVQPWRVPTVPGAGFVPTQGSPTRLVVLLSGSDGGHYPGSAAVLARHGFAVWTLPYFGGPKLPSELVSINVDQVADHLRALAADVDSDAPVALAGISRGAELALELASRLPDLIGPVVAVSPSAVRHGGLPRRWQRNDVPAWVNADGTAAPFAATLRSWSAMGTMVSTMLVPMLRRQPVAMRAAFSHIWQHSPDLDEARIDLGTANGPLLLWAGADDQMWPAETYARDIAERFGDRLRVQVEVDPWAGHLGCFPLALPGMPTPHVTDTPMVRYALGGNSGTASRAAAWTQGLVLDFLRQT